MDRKRIGEKLKALRGERSLDSIAAGIGISRSAIDMYERGERIPRDEIKLKIAAFFGVSVESLFFSD